MTDQMSVEKAKSGKYHIDEDKVETIPKNLLPFRDILLNIDTQNEAKKYFTEDGWTAVLNTLKVLKETCSHIKMRDIINEKCQTQPILEEELAVISPPTKKKFFKTNRSRKSSKVQRASIYSFKSESPPKSTILTASASISDTLSMKNQTKDCRIRLTDITTVKDLEMYESQKGHSAVKITPKKIKK